MPSETATATAPEQNTKGKNTAVEDAPAPMGPPTTVPESASKKRKICQKEPRSVSPHAAPVDASSASQPEKTPHYFSKFEVPKAFEKAPGMDKSEYERLLKEAKGDKNEKSARTKMPDPEQDENKGGKSHKNKSKDKGQEKDEKKRARSSKDSSPKKAKKSK